MNTKMTPEMSTEKRGAAPDGALQQEHEAEDTTAQVTARTPARAGLKISVRDRVVIALTLMVALGLCILLGTVLRVPGT